MKLHIEVDSENSADVAALRKVADALQSLFVEEEPIPVITDEVEKEPSGPVDELGRQILFPKQHGKSKEIILQILEHFDGGGKTKDIKRVTNMSEPTIHTALQELVKERVVAKQLCGDSKSYYYYIRKAGDPRARDVLRNAIGKFSN
jgi:predicted transcriptional regulator